jgi:Trypsin
MPRLTFPHLLWHGLLCAAAFLFCLSGRIGPCQLGLSFHKPAYGLEAADFIPQTGWWLDDNRPGTGIAIEVAPDGAGVLTLFMGVFFYEDNGAPTWFISGGPLSANLHYSGKLRRFQGGPTFDAPQNRGEELTDAGDVQLEFMSASQARLQLAGTSRIINRFEFAAIPVRVQRTPPPPAFRVPAKTGRILGGSPALPGAFPWMLAMVREGEAPAIGQFCGASVIGAKWAITTASCVTDGSGQTLKPHQLYLLAGTNSLQADGKRLRLSQILPHPAYQPRQMANNLALLELEFAQTLPPLALLTPRLEALLARAGVMATVVGWGATQLNPSDFPDLLQQAQLPIVGQEVCNGPQSYQGSVGADQLCAGFSQGGTDSCFLDTGGPLLVTDHQGGTRLAGIIADGRGCGLANFYGLYTRLSSFQNWISLVTGITPPAETGWYLNPQEPLSGYFFEWQAGQLFGVTFSYDANGAARWLLSRGMTDPTKQLYQGSLERFMGGEALNSAYRPPMAPESVGTHHIQTLSPVRGQFLAPNGRLIPIERFLFAGGTTLPPP